MENKRRRGREDKRNQQDDGRSTAGERLGATADEHLKKDNKKAIAEHGEDRTEKTCDMRRREGHPDRARRRGLTLWPAQEEDNRRTRVGFWGGFLELSFKSRTRGEQEKDKLRIQCSGAAKEGKGRTRGGQDEDKRRTRGGQDLDTEPRHKARTRSSGPRPDSVASSFFLRENPNSKLFGENSNNNVLYFKTNTSLFFQEWCSGR